MIWFSIICPTYNNEAYIEQTCKAVKEQTFRDFEFILVNDFSTDKTAEIAQNYFKDDPRFKLINNEQNLGVAKSRNVGIDNAEGRFIVFLDHDDLLSQNCLEELYKCIRNKPDFNVYSLWHNKVSSDGLHTWMHRAPPVPNQLYGVIGNAPPQHYFVWNKIFRREFLNKYGIRFVEVEGDTYDEDFMFVYAVNMFTAYTYVESVKPLYFHRVHDNELGWTRTDNERRAFCWREFLKYIERLKENNPDGYRLVGYKEAIGHAHEELVKCGYQS